MCTFKDERTVLVCDVAIGHVRRNLEKTFGNRVRYTPVEGQGTLVEAEGNVDGRPFTAIARAAIAEAQKV